MVAKMFEHAWMNIHCLHWEKNVTHARVDACLVVKWGSCQWGPNKMLETHHDEWLCMCLGLYFVRGDRLARCRAFVCVNAILGPIRSLRMRLICASGRGSRRVVGDVSVPMRLVPRNQGRMINLFGERKGLGKCIGIYIALHRFIAFMAPLPFTCILVHHGWGWHSYMVAFGMRMGVHDVVEHGYERNE